MYAFSDGVNDDRGSQVPNVMKWPSFWDGIFKSIFQNKCPFFEFKFQKFLFLTRIPGMPLVYPVYTGTPRATQRILAGYIGTPLEKLNWNCSTLECHWRNWCSLHWNTIGETVTSLIHDDVIKWKHFPRYRPYVRGIHRSPVNSPHKGQWRGALMFSLICARINGWVNNG